MSCSVHYSLTSANSISAYFGAPKNKHTAPARPVFCDSIRIAKRRGFPHVSRRQRDTASGAGSIQRPGCNAGSPRSGAAQRAGPRSAAGAWLCSASEAAALPGGCVGSTCSHSPHLLSRARSVGRASFILWSIIGKIAPEKHECAVLLAAAVSIEMTSFSLNKTIRTSRHTKLNGYRTSYHTRKGIGDSTSRGRAAPSSKRGRKRVGETAMR